MSDFLYSFEKLRVGNDARVFHPSVYDAMARQLIAWRESQRQA